MPPISLIFDTIPASRRVEHNAGRMNINCLLVKFIFHEVGLM